MGATNQKGGYGAFSIYRIRNGPIHAHRIAYAIANGKCPAGRVIMHLCDNKLCVNPAHLRAGSQKENVRDAMEKGLIARVHDCRVCGAPRHPNANMALCAPCFRDHREPYRRSLRAETRRLRPLEVVRQNKKRIRALPAVPPSTFAELVACTTRRQAEAFARFYGLYDFPIQDKTQIGARLGVSRERARQLVHQVLSHLRKGDHLRVSPVPSIERLAA
jgi:hypothetical protein